MPRRPASEMFEYLKDMAEEMFGEDDTEKENYISQHMKQLGYKMRITWDDADDDGGQRDSFTSSIFGGNRQRRDISSQKRASGGGFGQSQYQ